MAKLYGPDGKISILERRRADPMVWPLYIGDTGDLHTVIGVGHRRIIGLREIHCLS